MPPATGASLISITFFRGQMIFYRNTFSDGGATQLYGSAFDVIVAENTALRTDGFANWGLNPHNIGQQPAYCNSFVDNTIAAGNGYGTNQAIFWVTGFSNAGEVHNERIWGHSLTAFLP